MFGSHRFYAEGLDWGTGHEWMCEYFRRWPQLRCRLRVLRFFGGLRGNVLLQQCNITSRQIVTAFDDEISTFLGFWPRNEDAVRRHPPKAKRARVGLLLGKSPEYFNPLHPKIEGNIGKMTQATTVQIAVHALLSGGFNLETTCLPREGGDCGLPSEVSVIGRMSPQDYDENLQKYAFLLGVFEPRASPSPLEAMAAGVAFIGPLRYQHKPLSRLGAPYSYDVNMSDPSSVVEAANMSVSSRFSSFIPPAMTRQAMIERTCAILADEQPCLCIDQPASKMHCRGILNTMPPGPHYPWYTPQVPVLTRRT